MAKIIHLSDRRRVRHARATALRDATDLLEDLRDQLFDATYALEKAGDPDRWAEFEGDVAVPVEVEALEASADADVRALTRLWVELDALLDHLDPEGAVRRWATCT
jgi:hypothetical protein